MKKFLLELCLFFALSSAFCVGGEVFHQKTLSVLKTKYFDFIFSSETFDDVKKIASVADSYYLEITQKFGSEPYQRFPVSVTRSVESLNGFFSPFPYNMIVLYLAESDSAEMESYYDTVLSVFYHELTHAVTLNLKSPFLKKLSKIFGDFASFQALNLPYFWIEGAAVLNESSAEKNDGRLKNPFFTNLLIQAKLNDAAGVKSFPSWHDVLGARDTTPGGSDRYVFGACFAEFLVEKYGMEKYARFWQNAGNNAFFSFSAGVFEKTYGTKIGDEWGKFKDSIKIPDSPDLHENFQYVLSKKNAEIQAFDVFVDAKSKKNRIAFYDSVSHAVFLLEMDDEHSLRNRPKKLFSALGITELYFSDDGKNLLVKRLTAKKNVKIQKAVFNLKSKKYKILRNSDDETFSALRKNCVSVQKNGLSWSISLKMPGSDEKKYSPGEKIILSNPHFAKFEAENIFVSFSWAYFGEKNSDFFGGQLSKCGILKIDLKSGQGIFYLQKNEIFAGKTVHGVNYSALLDVSGKNTKFAAVLEDYDSSPLYEIELSPLENENLWKKIGALQSEKSSEIFQDEKFSSDENFDSKSKIVSDCENFKIEKYSSFPYLLKGTKLPLGIVPVKNGNFETDSTGFLGATYITSKPYLADLLFISAGYDPIFRNGGASLLFSDFDSSKKFSAESSLVFDKNVFKQMNGKIEFSKVFYRGVSSSYSGGISADLLYGRENETDAKIVFSADEKSETVKGSCWKNGFFGQSKLYLEFSNLRQAGKNVHCISGISFAPFISVEKKNYRLEFQKSGESAVFKSDFESEEKYLNAGAVSVFRIPFAVPLSFQASFFPSSSYFLYGIAKANLFTLEIQKGLPFLSLYAARFDLTLSYSGKFSYSHGDFWDITKSYEIASNLKKDDYSDCVALGAIFTLSPNTGYMADSSVQFQLGAKFSFRPNPKNGENRTQFAFTGSFGL